MSVDPPVKDFEILSQPEQLRVLAQSERLAVLRALSEEPLTGAQIADRLGIPANRAHYHLGQLLKYGLIRDAGRGRKRWKEERLFAPIARHFLIDPALGVAHEETSASLRRSAELAFFHWHRQEVVNVDLAGFVRKVVRECLRVQAGERVLLMFAPPAIDLGELLQVELEAAGAIPVLRIWSRSTTLRTLDIHDEEALRNLPFLPPSEDERLDAGIYLSTTIPQGSPPGPEQIAKLPLLLETVSRWHRSLRERRVRYLEVSIPHRDGFAGGALAPEAALDCYWRSLDADYPALSRRIDALVHLVVGETRFVLTDDRGSHLELELDPARIHRSDGILDARDIADGASFEELPAGSVSFLPKRGCGNGVLYVDTTYVGRGHVHDLKVVLKDGKAVEIAASKNSELLQMRLASAVGEWDVVSELRIGFNVRSAGLTGLATLDSTMSGVVTLGLGNNELLGGDVRSTFGLLFPSDRATLRAGGQVLVERGQLVD